jgi:hypothetical protein
MICKHCDIDREPIVVPLETGPHYSKLMCVNCGAHMGFGKKPGNEGKRAKNKYTPESLEKDFCEVCMRPGKRLEGRTVLEIHHVKEIGKGGDDVPENIWVVCSSCHRLIHHQRVYLNEHNKGLYAKADLLKDIDRYGITGEIEAKLKQLYDKWEAHHA